MLSVVGSSLIVTELTKGFPTRTRPFEHYAIKKTKFIDMGAKEDKGGIWIKDFKFDDEKYGDVEYNGQFKNWIVALIAQDASGLRQGKWRFWTQNWCTNEQLRAMKDSIGVHYVWENCKMIAAFHLCADGSTGPCVEEK